MRLIKLALLSFIFLFLLVTGISLFIPSSVRISKAVNIHAAFDSVYQEVSKIQNWKNWHPALKDLLEDEFVFLEDGSMKVKNDFLRITQKNKNEVMAEFRKEGGRSLVSGMNFISHPPGDSLTVQWYMEFRLHWYPWEKFRSLFYENIYGVQMEQGLSNLRQLMESRRSSLN